MANSFITDKSESESAKSEERCIPESSFDLEKIHIPPHAYIDRAYLVWMGAVDPSIVKNRGPLDNKVSLKFVPEQYNNIFQKNVVGPEMKAQKVKGSFEFEYLSGDMIKSDLSENEKASVGFFTYRVDVTDYFKEIHAAAGEKDFLDRDSIIGRYTVSGLDCTESEIYRKNEMMLSSWALILVYRSQEVYSKSKSIYIYPSFSSVKKDSFETDFQIDRFSLLEEIRVTTAVGGGKKDSSSEEGLTLTIDRPVEAENEFTAGEFPLRQKCDDEQSEDQRAVFDSTSSIPFFRDDGSSVNQCLDQPESIGLDVDTFYSPSIYGHYYYPPVLNGKLGFHAGEDRIFPNFFVLSHDLWDCGHLTAPGYRFAKTCSNYTDEGNYPTICAGGTFYVLVEIRHTCWHNILMRPSIKFFFEGNVEYVSGSSEISYGTADADKSALWKSIPDKNGGAIPFDESYILKNELRYREDPILVRFKLKHLKKEGYVNILTDFSHGDDYSRETLYRYFGIHLQALEECPDTPIELCSDSCGGCNACSNDSECPEDYYCEKAESTCRLFSEKEQGDADELSDEDSDELLIDASVSEKDKKSFHGCTLTFI